MSKISAVLLTAIISVVCTSIVWVGIGALVYKTWLSDDPLLSAEPFVVELEAPSTAAVGEVFTMNVTATNTGEKDTTLGSIDIYDTFLDGFEVVGVMPKPERDNAIFDFHSYYFDGIRLQPGESASVSFELKAAKPGKWQGDVDCCTPMENFSTAVAWIVVTDPAAQ